MPKLVRNKFNKRRRNGKGVTRAKGTIVLAQGAAVAPRRAVGSGKMSIPRGLPPFCWDATHSSHAALPRAVGPYTVVRTTQLITTKSPMMIFGTFSTQDIGLGATTGALSDGTGTGQKFWTNVCAAGIMPEATNAQVTGPVFDNQVTQFHTVPAPGAASTGAFGLPNTATGSGTFYTSNSNLTCVPSALTVQLISPEPVQTAAGTAVAAVCPVRMNLRDSPKSYKTIADEVVSYFRPRVLTGGKLALRGVKMDSFPLSMTDVSDFRPAWKLDPQIAAPSHLYWSGADNQQGITAGNGFSEIQKKFRVNLEPEGWAPIVYYNPYNMPTEAVVEGKEQQEMSFMVTMEWRVRFDLSNPAASTHMMHKPSTDSQWHEHIRRASDALPGVIDIVEKVANAGLSAYKAYNAGVAMAA